MAIVARNKYTVSIHRGDCPFESLKPKYGFFIMGDEPKHVELVSSVGYSERFCLTHVYYSAPSHLDRVVRASVIHALERLDGSAFGLLLRQLTSCPGVEIAIGTLNEYVELLDPESEILGMKKCNWRKVSIDSGLAVGEVDPIIERFLMHDNKKDLLEYIAMLNAFSVGPKGQTVEVIPPEIIRRTNITN